MTDTAFKLITRYNNKILKSRIRSNWPDDFPVPPFDHQIDGAAAFLRSDGRMLLGWEMGSGKTIGAALILHIIKAGPTLMFAPASLLLQHKAELQRVLPEREIEIFTGEEIHVKDFTKVIVLCSYHKTHKVRNWITGLPIKFEFVICDESTFIKNPKARRTKDVTAICKITPFVLMLSGTPIINRPVDLFTQLRITNPDKFTDWWKFTRRYCKGHQGPFGYDATGLSNAGELHSMISSIMHRVKKSDCLDLPSKMRKKLPVTVKLAAEYDTWHEEVEALGNAKAEAAVYWLLDWYAATADTNEKIVVFTRHVETAKYLSKQVPHIAGVITGETPLSTRTRILNHFKQGPRILIMTLGTGGTGLNLQYASHMLFVEMSFSPMEMLQAEDRIHRSGMSGDCHINYMIADKTYDDALFKLLINKMNMANHVIDGSVTETQNIFKQLFQDKYSSLINEVA